MTQQHSDIRAEGGEEAQQERVIGALLAYASRQSELGREFARRMQMHPTDAVAIVTLLRAEERGQPLTPARLAEHLDLTSGATSILLNRLEVAGHLVRSREHADRRLVTLHSTPSVHQAAADFFGPLRTQLGTLMARYTPEQLHLIERFVEELQEAVDRYPDAEP